MVIAATMAFKFTLARSILQSSLFHSIPLSQTLEQSIRAAIESKAYKQILLLLSPSSTTTISTVKPKQKPNPNPFSFLSTYPQDHRTQIIDEILQSFITVRPRSRPQMAYACLLSYTLQSPDPLPLAFAILQRTIRSGCIPAPQTHLSISSAWIERRNQSQSVSDLLLEMRSIGYRPDCNTCNYLISSLCSVDQLAEAIMVLRGMGGAGCDPDSESYGTVIGAMCVMRRTNEVMELVTEMVGKVGLMPRQGVVLSALAAMRANREVRRAVEMVEFLERTGCTMGFESYEMVVEGCLERGECVLAGMVVMKMTERGFIPYIDVRQKVVEGLAGIGEWKLACAVRQRLAELRS